MPVKYKTSIYIVRRISKMFDSACAFALLKKKSGVPGGGDPLHNTRSRRPPVKQNAGQSTLQGMLKSTIVFRRQFKIVGQIGQPNEKDKLSFTFLTRQIDTGVKQGQNTKLWTGLFVQLMVKWLFEVM